MSHITPDGFHRQSRGRTPKIKHRRGGKKKTGKKFLKPHWLKDSTKHEIWQSLHQRKNVTQKKGPGKKTVGNKSYPFAKGTSKKVRGQHWNRTYPKKKKKNPLKTFRGGKPPAKNCPVYNHLQKKGWENGQKVDEAILKNPRTNQAKTNHKIKDRLPRLRITKKRHPTSQAIWSVL